MTYFNSPTDALAAIHLECVDAIRSGVRDLLERKHLYQSVTIDPAAIVKSNFEQLREGLQSPSLKIQFASVSRWVWRLKDDDDILGRLANQSGTPEPREFLWAAPDIKTYCQRCGRIEPFNLTSSQTLLPRPGATKQDYIDIKGRVQIYSLSYLCQSCKSVPELFFLRRLGNRLQLCGRAPMEAVDVPKYLPAEVASYFSGAQIAFQSGQTLAGLFMLRTMCEQWVRGYAGDADKADVALERYAESLPSDFSDRFPSLKAVYGKLSDALHRANGDDSLFNTTVEQLCEHFEARKVFKLAGPTAKTRAK